MHKRHAAAAAALFVTVGSLSVPVAAQASAASTFYVNGGVTRCSDVTTDSAAQPFCSIQAAVNQATSPGDTVVVTPGRILYTSFTVTASGTAAAPITIVNADGDRFNAAASLDTSVTVDARTTEPALTVSGASYVNIEGLSFSASQTVVDVAASSSHVVLDSNSISQEGTQTAGPTVTIAAGTSAITLSRNWISSLAASPAVIAATGSSGDVFATNKVQGTPEGPGILLSGTTNSDVTGNTLLDGCGSQLAFTAGSTGTSIENNVLGQLIPHSIGCPVTDTEAAMLRVDAASVAGTTVDYNDVYTATFPSFSPAAYTWAGSAYATSAAFASATGQGVHDVNAIETGNAIIDSADSSAPGELSTDLYGNPRVDDPQVPNTGAGTYAYYDRGALEAQDQVTIGLGAWPTQMPLATPGTFTATAGDSWQSGIANCTYDFGDGSAPVTVAATNRSCSAQHAYIVAGGYTIQLVVTANDGATATKSSRVSASGTNELLPKVSVQQYSSREALVADSGTHAWNIVRCVVDFGDGTTPVTVNNVCDANHTYAGIGTFTITITDTDSGGNTASATGSFTASGYYFNPVAPVRVLDTRKPIGVPSVAAVPPGGVVKLQLAGTGGIPADASAVTMNVTVTHPTAGGYLTVYPDGTTAPTASNLNFTTGSTVPNVVVAKLGADGAVDFENSSAGTVDLVADLEGYYAVTGDSYDVGSANRVIDTRQTHQTLPANGTLRVNLSAPPSFQAATLNVTVTNAAAGGYLTAYPDGVAMPTASNLNFAAHQTVANEVVVEIGSDGYVDFTNSSAGTVDVIVDYNGDFETSNAGAAYTPIAPTRFLDTRKGIGDFQESPPSSGALPAFGTGLLSISGDAKITAVPANALAAAMNVTVTRPTSGGYITAYPSSQTTRPLTSTLNFAAGQTIANAAMMLMSNPGPGGIYLYNGSGGNVQLVVDVFGYYS
jgi:hypothetical protein